MYLIDCIKLNYEPRKRISVQIPELPDKIKMYERDSAFVCGLLEKFKPEKIVEVGIANGGTSAVIMQCMELQGLKYELHCVDKLQKGYAGDSREIGFIGTEAAALLHFDQYHLWKGVILPEVIEQIGPGIDFLILDTTHKLPGEVLDFLTAYPYLTEHAVICLHDISQNQKTPHRPEHIATNVLFNSVAADKFINRDPEREPDYPNIGAFQINPDTRSYITNVFGALTQNWYYSLPKKELALYTDVIRLHYPEEASWLYDHAVQMNIKSLSSYHHKTQYFVNGMLSLPRKIKKLFGK